MRNKVIDSLDNVRKSKPFYRFWYNKVEKEMLYEANKLSLHADKLEERNKQVGENRFFSAYECHKKIEALLKQNGFILSSTYSEGDSCNTTTEIWKLEE